MKYILFLILLAGSSCQQEFLEMKSSQSQKVPVLISDFQALLDNTTDVTHAMNLRTAHMLGISGADELLIPEGTFQTLSSEGQYAYQKNSYIWTKDVFAPVIGQLNEPYDFNVGYAKILRANIVMEGLAKITRTEHNAEEWDNAMGSALFHRAVNYYNLCQLFCEPFGKGELSQKLGMPLRLEADPTTKIKRSTLEETLRVIQRDIKEAEMLLPEQGVNVFRPSQLAVWALKARLFLQLSDFEKALAEVDKVLAVRQQLTDYNDLKATVNYTFPLYGIGNAEVIWSSAAYNAVTLTNNIMRVEPTLFNQYEDQDLRKSLFFKTEKDGSITYWGSYHGNNMHFTGFGLDEIYLVKAEVLARMGQVEEACNVLNKLRVKRYSKDGFVPMETSDKQEALQAILLERRKQLIFRGVRWEDLRRLNLESDFQTVLNRRIGSEEYTLLPNDKRYVWPFHPEAIESGGFEQNER